MINVRTLLMSCILFASGTIAFAATDSGQLNFKVSYAPYVTLIGTAPGSTRVYDNDDIANWIFPSVVDLGTLGLESNIPGNCNITFTTINDFELLHTLSSNSLTQYKLLYQSQEFSNTSNPILSTPCSTIPTTLEFTPTQIVWPNIFPSVTMEHGIYQDTVTLVVTSP